MKVLYFNGSGEHYLYPNGVNSIDEFAEYLEKNNTKFLKLRRLFEKNCVAPYYIFEEISEVYVSTGLIDEFYEEEVVVLDEKEYNKMLENIKKKLCYKCEDRGECLTSPKQDFREKICLDGSCDEFCEEDDE